MSKYPEGFNMYKCRVCNEYFTYNEMSKDNSRKSGLATICKQCDSARTKYNKMKRNDVVLAKSRRRNIRHGVKNTTQYYKGVFKKEPDEPDKKMVYRFAKDYQETTGEMPSKKIITKMTNLSFNKITYIIKLLKDNISYVKLGGINED